MKKNIAFALVLIAFGVFTSCKQDPAKMILGTWKLTNVESSAVMNDIEKQMFKETNDDIVAKEKYTFSAEKLILSYDKTDTEATWQLSPDAKTLKITMSDGKEFTYDIIEFTESKLVWSEKTEEKYSITTSLEKVQ